VFLRDVLPWTHWAEKSRNGKTNSNNAAVYYQNKNNERHYFIAYTELGADKMQEDTLSLLFSADE